MTSKEYNGWTNYETWLVKLWIDSDESLSLCWQHTARHAYKEAKPCPIFTKSETAKLTLGKKLEEHYEDERCNLMEKTGTESSVWADLLTSALSEVNWHEIADSLLSRHIPEYNAEEIKESIV